MSDRDPNERTIDLPLPLLADPPTLPEAWARVHAVPTTLVALCPDDAPPTLDAVRNTVAELLGDAFVDCGAIENPPGEAYWSLVVGIGGTERRILLWAEPARDLDPEELDDADARTCRFAVLLEMILDPREPLDEFMRAIRLLAALVPDCPALLDLQARTWHLPAGLMREFLAADADPPDWALWTVTAASPSHGRGPAWICTSGLARCGLPELEMLGVPIEHVRTAVALLNDLAGLLLEEPPPSPGELWEIGPDIAVTLRPWRDVAASLPPDVPGSLDSRRLSPDVEATVGADHPFAGVRAIVCDVRNAAACGDAADAAWPAAVAAQIEAGGVAMYRAQRATSREARLAQRTFDRLAIAFASLQRDGADAGSDDGPAFFVKGCVSLGDGDDDGNEHLWMRLLRVDRNGGMQTTLHARLVHPPSAIDWLHEGDEIDLAPVQVSSWQVICDGTLFVPDVVDAMTNAIDAHRARRAAALARGG